MSQKLYRRAISALTSIVFVSVSIVSPTPTNVYAQSQPSLSAFSLANFKLPEEIGVMQEYSPPAGSKRLPTIIHIQDAHAVYHAQKSIQAIIDYLQKNHGLPLVAVEGAVGPLDPVLFRTFPVEEVKKKVFDELMRKGEVSGVDASSILNTGWSDFVGIEDKELYLDDRDAFIAAIKTKENADRALRELQAKNLRKKTEIYSPQLLEFDRHVEAFEQDSAELFNLLDWLSTQKFEISATHYPQLYLLIQQLGEDKKKEAYQKEHGDILLMKLAGQVKAKLTPEEFKEFNQYRSAFQTKGERVHFVEFLFRKAKEKGISLATFESLIGIEKRRAELLSVAGEDFFTEFKTFIEKRKGFLFHSEEERDLDREARELKLFLKLASLEITREELQEISSRAADLSLLKPAFRFYELALRRDRVLFENLTKEIRNKKAPYAVVVTGGFHTDGIKAFLKEEGYPYLVIAPKIKEIGESPYLDVMLEKDLSYGGYLKTETSQIALMDPLASDLDPTRWEAIKNVWTGKLAKEALDMEGRSLEAILRTWRDSIVKFLLESRPSTDSKKYTEFLMEIHREMASLYRSDVGKQTVINSITKMLQGFVQEQMNPAQIQQTYEKFFNEVQKNIAAGADTTKSVLDALKNVLNYTPPTARPSVEPFVTAKDLISSVREEIYQEMDLDVARRYKRPVYHVLRAIRETPEILQPLKKEIATRKSQVDAYPLVQTGEIGTTTPPRKMKVSLRSDITKSAIEGAKRTGVKLGVQPVAVQKAIELGIIDLLSGVNPPHKTAISTDMTARAEVRRTESTVSRSEPEPAPDEVDSDLVDTPVAEDDSNTLKDQQELPKYRLVFDPDVVEKFPGETKEERLEELREMIKQGEVEVDGKRVNAFEALKDELERRNIPKGVSVYIDLKTKEIKDDKSKSEIVITKLRRVKNPGWAKQKRTSFSRPSIQIPTGNTQLDLNSPLSGSSEADLSLDPGEDDSLQRILDEVAEEAAQDDDLGEKPTEAPLSPRSVAKRAEVRAVELNNFVREIRSLNPQFTNRREMILAGILMAAFRDFLEPKFLEENQGIVPYLDLLQEMAAQKNPKEFLERLRNKVFAIQKKDGNLLYPKLVEAIYGHLVAQENPPLVIKNKKVLIRELETPQPIEAAERIAQYEKTIENIDTWFRQAVRRESLGTMEKLIDLWAQKLERSNLDFKQVRVKLTHAYNLARKVIVKEDKILRIIVLRKLKAARRKVLSAKIKQWIQSGTVGSGPIIEEEEIKPGDLFRNKDDGKIYVYRGRQSGIQVSKFIGPIQSEFFTLIPLSRQGPHLHMSFDYLKAIYEKVILPGRAEVRAGKDWVKEILEPIIQGDLKAARKSYADQRERLSELEGEPRKLGNARLQLLKGAIQLERGRIDSKTILEIKPEGLYVGDKRVGSRMEDQKNLFRAVAVKGEHSSQIFKVALDTVTNDSLLQEVVMLAILQRSPPVPGVPRLLKIGLTRDDFLWVQLDGIERGTALEPDSFSNPGELFKVMIQVAQILKTVHSKKLVHNDISENNILVNRQGKVQFNDFGLATPVSTSIPTFPGHAPTTDDGSGPANPRNRDTDIFSFILMLTRLLEYQIEKPGAAIPKRLKGIRQKYLNMIFIGGDITRQRPRKEWKLKQVEDLLRLLRQDKKSVASRAEMRMGIPLLRGHEVPEAILDPGLLRFARNDERGRTEVRRREEGDIQDALRLLLASAQPYFDYRPQDPKDIDIVTLLSAPSFRTGDWLRALGGSEGLDFAGRFLAPLPSKFFQLPQLPLDSKAQAEVEEHFRERPYGRSSNPAIQRLADESYWRALEQNEKLRAFLGAGTLNRFRKVLMMPAVQKIFGKDSSYSDGLRQTVLLLALHLSKNSRLALSSIESPISKEIEALHHQEQEEGRLFYSLGVEVEITHNNLEKGKSFDGDTEAVIFYHILGGRLGYDEVIEYALEPAYSGASVARSLELMEEIGLIPNRVRPHNMHINTLLPTLFKKLRLIHDYATLIAVAGVLGYTHADRIRQFTEERWRPIDSKEDGIQKMVGKKPEEKKSEAEKELERIRLEYRLADSFDKKTLSYFHFLHGLMAQTALSAYKLSQDPAPSFSRLEYELARVFDEFISEMKALKKEGRPALEQDWFSPSNETMGRELNGMKADRELMRRMENTIQGALLKSIELMKQTDTLAPLKNVSADEMRSLNVINALSEEMKQYEPAQKKLELPSSVFNFFRRQYSQQYSQISSYKMPDFENYRFEIPEPPRISSFQFEIFVKTPSLEFPQIKQINIDWESLAGSLRPSWWERVLFRWISFLKALPFGMGSPLIWFTRLIWKKRTNAVLATIAFRDLEQQQEKNLAKLLEKLPRSFISRTGLTNWIQARKGERAFEDLPGWVTSAFEAIIQYQSVSNKIFEQRAKRDNKGLLPFKEGLALEDLEQALRDFINIAFAFREYARQASRQNMRPFFSQNSRNLLRQAGEYIAKIKTEMARREQTALATPRAEVREMRKINGGNAAHAGDLANLGIQTSQLPPSETSLPDNPIMGFVQSSSTPSGFNSINPPDQNMKGSDNHTSQNEKPQPLGVKNQGNQVRSENRQKDLGGVVPTSGIKSHAAKNIRIVTNNQAIFLDSLTPSRAEVRGDELPSLPGTENRLGQSGLSDHRGKKPTRIFGISGINRNQPMAPPDVPSPLLVGPNLALQSKPVLSENPDKVALGEGKATQEAGRQNAGERFALGRSGRSFPTSGGAGEALPEGTPANNPTKPEKGLGGERGHGGFADQGFPGSSADILPSSGAPQGLNPPERQGPAPGIAQYNGLLPDERNSGLPLDTSAFYFPSAKPNVSPPPQAVKDTSRAEVRASISSLKQDINKFEKQIESIGISNLPTLGFHGQAPRQNNTYFYFVFKDPYEFLLNENSNMSAEEFLERLQGTVISTANYSEFDWSKNIMPIIHLLTNYDKFDLVGSNDKDPKGKMNMVDPEQKKINKFRYFYREGSVTPAEVPPKAIHAITITPEEFKEIEEIAARMAVPSIGISEESVKSYFSYRLLYKKTLQTILNLSARSEVRGDRNQEGVTRRDVLKITAATVVSQIFPTDLLTSMTGIGSEDLLQRANQEINEMVQRLGYNPWIVQSFKELGISSDDFLKQTSLMIAGDPHGKNPALVQRASFVANTLRNKYREALASVVRNKPPVTDDDFFRLWFTDFQEIASRYDSVAQTALGHMRDFASWAMNPGNLPDERTMGQKVDEWEKEGIDKFNQIESKRAQAEGGPTLKDEIFGAMRQVRKDMAMIQTIRATTERNFNAMDRSPDEFYQLQQSIQLLQSFDRALKAIYYGKQQAFVDQILRRPTTDVHSFSVFLGDVIELSKGRGKFHLPQQIQEIYFLLNDALAEKGRAMQRSVAIETDSFERQLGRSEMRSVKRAEDSTFINALVSPQRLEESIVELEKEFTAIGSKNLPRIAFHGEPKGHVPEGNFNYYVYDSREVYYSRLSEKEFLEMLRHTVSRAYGWGVEKAESGEIYLLIDTPSFKLNFEGLVDENMLHWDLPTNSYQYVDFFNIEGGHDAEEIMKNSDAILAKLNLSSEEKTFVQQWTEEFLQEKAKAGVSILRVGDRSVQIREGVQYLREIDVRSYLTDSFLYRKTLAALIKLAKEVSKASVTGTQEEDKQEPRRAEVRLPVGGRQPFATIAKKFQQQIKEPIIDNEPAQALLYELATDLRAILYFAKDPEAMIWTLNHEWSVSMDAVEFGRRLGIKGKDLAVLAAGAAIHDIGKVRIDPALLNKPGQLTPEERKAVSKHVLTGLRIFDDFIKILRVFSANAEIFKNMDDEGIAKRIFSEGIRELTLKEATAFIRDNRERLKSPILDELVRDKGAIRKIRKLITMHHETADGKGYPYGRSNHSLWNQIILVADTGDAWRSDRPYRKRESETAIERFFSEWEGIKFRPDVLAVYREIHGERILSSGVRTVLGVSFEDAAIPLAEEIEKAKADYPKDHAADILGVFKFDDKGSLHFLVAPGWTVKGEKFKATTHEKLQNQLMQNTIAEGIELPQYAVHLTLKVDENGDLSNVYLAPVNINRESEGEVQKAQQDISKIARLIYQSLTKDKVGKGLEELKALPVNLLLEVSRRFTLGDFNGSFSPRAEVRRTAQRSTAQRSSPAVARNDFSEASRFLLAVKGLEAISPEEEREGFQALVRIVANPNPQLFQDFKALHIANINEKLKTFGPEQLRLVVLDIMLQPEAIIERLKEAGFPYDTRVQREELRKLSGKITAALGELSLAANQAAVITRAAEEGIQRLGTSAAAPFVAEAIQQISQEILDKVANREDETPVVILLRIDAIDPEQIPALVESIGRNELGVINGRIIIYFDFKKQNHLERVKRFENQFKRLSSEQRVQIPYKFNSYADWATGTADIVIAYNGSVVQGKGAIALTSEAIPRAVNQALNDPARIPAEFRSLSNTIMAALAVKIAKLKETKSEAAKAEIRRLQTQFQEYGINIGDGAFGNIVVTLSLAKLIQRIQMQAETLRVQKAAA